MPRVEIANANFCLTPMRLEFTTRQQSFSDITTFNSNSSWGVAMSRALNAKNRSRRAVQRRKHRAQRAAYVWLGTGAVTLGVGAALAGGSGVAHADSASSDTSASTSSSAESSTDRQPHTGKPNTGPAKKRPEGKMRSSGKDRPTAPERATKPDRETTTNPASPADTRDTVTETPKPKPANKAFLKPKTDNTRPKVLQTAKVRSGSVDSDGTAAMSLPASRSAKAESATAPADTEPRAATERDPVGGLIRQIQETFFNQSPIAKPAQIRQEPDGTIIGKIGASDPEEDPLSYRVSERPQHGTVVIHANGDYTYTPNPEFASTGGTDTFTATVSETNAAQHVHGPIGLINRVIRAVSFGLLNPNDGSYVDTPVTVNVTAVNHAPVAGRPEVASPDPATGVVTGKVIATDPDGDTLTYTGSGVTPRGSVVVEGDGSFTYTPTTQARLAAYSTVGADYDEFTVTVTDGRGGTTTVAVKDILVDPVHAAVTDTITIPDIVSSDVAVGPDGTRYYTRFIRVSSEAALTRVLVFNPADAHTRAVIDIPGSPEGGVVLGPDGKIHQTTEGYGTDGRVTRVAIIDPSDYLNPTIIKTIGRPIGGVVLGPDGTVYQTTFSGSSSDRITHVTVIDPDAPTNSATIDTRGTSAGRVIVAPSGKAFLTTGTGNHRDGYVTHVTVIDPADPQTSVTFDLPGTVPVDRYSEGIPAPVAIGSDGTVYQTTATESATRVTIFSPGDPAHPTAIDIDGRANGGVIIGPDGSAYQTTATTGPTSTRVTVIDPQAPADSITVVLPGTPYIGGGSDGPSTWVNGSVVFGQDGTVYQLTYTRTGPSTPNINHVAVIDPTGIAHPTVVDVVGKLNDYGFVTGPDGSAYLTTYTGNFTEGYVTRVTVIDPSDRSHTTTFDVPGVAYLGDAGIEPRGGAVVGADGTAYQVTFTWVNQGDVLYTTHVTLLDSEDPVTVDLPSAIRVNRALVGPDGTAFVSSRFGNLMQLAVIDPDNPTHPSVVAIAGQRTDDLVFGPDGTAFQTTQSEPSTGKYLTQVTVIDPANPMNLSRIEFDGRPVGGVESGPDGTFYQTSVLASGESVIHVISLAPRPAVAV